MLTTIKSMTYFLVAADGKKYGPATVETLISWAADHRLSMQSTLIDEFGDKVKAGDVEGVFPHVDTKPSKSWRSA
jgi:hypothetical protein